MKEVIAHFFPMTESCLLRMIFAAMTALLLTITCGKTTIQLLKKFKIKNEIRTSNCPTLAKLHQLKQSTPTMGGVLIIFSILITALIWMNLSNIFTWILCLTMLMIGALGFIDDYKKIKYRNSKGIKGKKKLMIQILIGSLIGAYLLIPSFQELCGHLFKTPIIKQLTEEEFTQIPLSQFASRVYLPFIKEPFQFEGYFRFALILFFIFVISGCSNGVNLTDGLDGLAIGVSILTAMGFALIAFVSNHIELAAYFHTPYIEGSCEIAIFLAIVVGASIGFLWFNAYPAQIFMGDTGSLTLGAILGVSAVLLKKEFLLALIGGVFVIETLSVILQVASFRLRNQKRIFLCAPLHHHFEYLGWSETKVVMRFWILSLLFTLIGILSLRCL